MYCLIFWLFSLALFGFAFLLKDIVRLGFGFFFWLLFSAFGFIFFVFLHPHVHIHIRNHQSPITITEYNYDYSQTFAIRSYQRRLKIGDRSFAAMTAMMVVTGGGLGDGKDGEMSGMTGRMMVGWDLGKARSVCYGIKLSIYKG